nr:glycosyltransferase [Kineothrix sp. MSJ-39]
MAAYYAKGTNDYEYLLRYYEEYKQYNETNVSPVSIVIVSYNSQAIMKSCIKTIQLYNPGTSYEIVVVDNNSTDGIREWLKEQKDIKLICNDTNTGFAYACNQGAEAACKKNDIFFLNNDTLVPQNAIFWLRMGLYENKQVGATGSVTNYAGNGQRVEENIADVEGWFQYARKINIPMQNAYEKKTSLIGFALLIKRHVFDRVGMFDLRFGKGNYEDNDLGLRILQAGYLLNLCHNSFIYHFGSLGFRQNDLREYAELLKENQQKIAEKWGFDIPRYMNVKTELIDFISNEKNEDIHVLEVGCGLGATLASILYQWPNADVKGIEAEEKIASLGANYLDIRQGNIENSPLEYEEEYFDYIILGDTLEQVYDPEGILQKMLPLLKKDGSIIASISNVQHVSVLLPLLRGNFEYAETGIIDKNHVRFFTLKSMVNMLKRNCFEIEKLVNIYREEDIIEQEKELYSILAGLLGKQFEEQSNAYKYAFRARRIG